MKILHLTNVYEGGVSRAIETIVRMTPEHRHLLLAQGADVGNGKVGFDTVDRLPDGIWSAVAATRRFVEQYKPDVVHAHSSWAGLYARATTLPVPVVYQPHCFVVEDRARSPLARAVYHCAENLLSARSSVTVALTEHEAGLARDLIGHRFARQVKPVIIVPNAPTRISELRHPATRRDRPLSTGPRPIVVMSGRICAQKDPGYFVRVVSEMRSERADLEFRWIGDGDTGLKRTLESAGVEVTGWLDGRHLQGELANASVYVHSAAYEGFPLSVLDAVDHHVPVVVRSIPCFDGTGLPAGDDPREIASTALRILSEDRSAAAARNAGDRLLSFMNEDKQRTALRSVYTHATTTERMSQR